MRAPISHDSRLATGGVLGLLTLLWLAGAAIRVPILDIPPVVPLIRDAFRMSETEVGLLSGLPLGMFALMAVPGSYLVARLGAVRTVVVGLLITAIASSARGAAPEVLSLYALTVLLGFGIAIVQPALPRLVREWLPDRIGLGTAVTTNGFLMGSTLATGLSLPLIMPLVGNSWRLDLAVWGIPVLVALVAMAAFAPRSQAAPRDTVPSVADWLPDWKSPLVWMLGLTLGSNTAVFFGVNAFIPEHLHAIGRDDLVSETLFWVNASQLLASFLLLAVADRLQRRAWSYTLFGPVSMLGVLGIMFGEGYWIVAAAALIGFGCAITFVVTLAQPPVLAPAHDIHRVAAGMFTIAYTFGILLPVVSGAAWDLTGVSQMAFVPFLIGLVALSVFGALLMRFPAVGR